MTGIRVVHVPGRTPYARKLRDATVQIVNATTVDGLEVPRDVTPGWLLGHRPWDWFDVVHLHHLDFEPLTQLRLALAEYERAQKGVVATVHDTSPVFGDVVTHRRRLRLLADRRVPMVCLTGRSAAELRQGFGVRPMVVPHGYVAVPGTPTRSEQRQPGPTRFLLYGSLRRNRDVEILLHCWRFASRLRNTTLRLLLRAPSRVSLADDSGVWKAIRDHAADPRLMVDVVPYPTDDEVNQAMADTDCLMLPYRWASHSGQLEHAFDLGVLPVASQTGSLTDQVLLHGGYVDPPIWFDWTDGAQFTYGERLLTAMQQAHRMIQTGWHARDGEAFRAHRVQEHASVMEAHRDLYQCNLQGNVR